MALHPGSLSAAYAKLQEYGFSMGTMRNACEQAAYRGSHSLRPVLVTFDAEHGYRVIRTNTTNPDASYLSSLAAEQAAQDDEADARELPRTENMRMHMHYTHGRDLADAGSYADLKAEHDSLPCPPPAERDDLADARELSRIESSACDR